MKNLVRNFRKIQQLHQIENNNIFPLTFSQFGSNKESDISSQMRLIFWKKLYRFELQN